MKVLIGLVALALMCSTGYAQECSRDPQLYSVAFAKVLGVIDPNNSATISKADFDAKRYEFTKLTKWASGLKDPCHKKLYQQVIVDIERRLLSRVPPAELLGIKDNSGLPSPPK